MVQLSSQERFRCSYLMSAIFTPCVVRDFIWHRFVHDRMLVRSVQQDCIFFVFSASLSQVRWCRVWSVFGEEVHVTAAVVKTASCLWHVLRQAHKRSESPRYRGDSELGFRWVVYTRWPNVWKQSSFSILFCFDFEYSQALLIGHDSASFHTTPRKVKHSHVISINWGLHNEVKKIVSWIRSKLQLRFHEMDPETGMSHSNDGIPRWELL